MKSQRTVIELTKAYPYYVDMFARQNQLTRVQENVTKMRKGKFLLREIILKMEWSVIDLTKAYHVYVYERKYDKTFAGEVLTKTTRECELGSEN